MRNLMIFAAVMAVLGTFMAQMADKMTPTPALASTALRKAAPAETTGQAGIRSLSIPSDSRGHFQTEGRIDAFVHAVGTASCLRGVATVLKRHNPAIRIVAVEPGLYHPELGGIRFEDDILITDSGYEVLTKSRIVRL